MRTMTREEYEREFGVAPVLPSISTIDTTPAPRRMTREEYEAEFGGKAKENFAQDTVSDIKQTGTSLKNTFRKTTGKMKESLTASIEGKQPLYKGLTQAFGYGAGGISSAVGDIFTGAVKTVLPQETKIIGSTIIPGEEQVKKTISGVVELGKKADEKLGSPLGKLTKETVEGYELMTEEQKRDIDAQIGIVSLASEFLGLGLTKKPVGKFLRENYDAAVKSYQVGKAEKAVAKETFATSNLEKEIYNIENNYAKTRKANEYQADAGAESRRRIAQTDVLVGAVDADGTIRTKQPGGAVEKYQKMTIDGRENTVRENLKREGEKINLAEVERELALEMDKTFEGEDLITALRGIKKEIEGLKARADEFGDVTLDKVHDAKINTTKHIDYNTPAETKTYRKAKARVYKTLVENKSKFRIDVEGQKVGVKEINKVLGQYYKDIERLENLDGKKDKGGKLGKYVAQISGNIAGGAIGGALGGMTGAALGTIIGGEVTSALKGRIMSRTFGKARGVTLPKNEILEKAAAAGKLPATPNLRVPSPKVGAGKNVPKTKEITKIEAQIARNVEAQKKAIAKGDFTLVATLKEVYNQLVSKLKELIQKYKDTPNKQGGFAKNPFAQTSKSDTPKGKQSKISSQSSSSNTTTQSKGQPRDKIGRYDTKGYKETGNLTTKILKDLEGKTTVSKQYILDATNRGEIKQVERDLIREVLDEMGINTEDMNIATDFIDSIRTKKVGGASITDKQKLDFEIEARRLAPGWKINPELPPSKLADAFDNYLTKNKDTINVSDFAKKVKAELLPLKRNDDLGPSVMGGYKYENITLPDELRGNVENYSENIYESPIKTSAGDIHFSGDTKNYFGHTRIEDMADNKTRRVIEVQSDLYQKGNLEGEEGFKAIELGKQLTREDKEILTKVAREAKTMREFFDNVPGDSFTGLRKLPQVSDEALYNFAKEGFPEKASIQKLQQYNDPTAHFRMIREEIKKASQDGKTKLQFPTGETALKIEGLGSRNNWVLYDEFGENVDLTEDLLKVDKEVKDGAGHWIITDVLGDGKFKAVPKRMYDDANVAGGGGMDRIVDAHRGQTLRSFEETFDISGKVDTNNPIYKFYEKDIQKYLNKFGGKRIVDDKGVSWIEVPIKKEWAKMPVEAFALLAATGLGVLGNEK